MSADNWAICPRCREGARKAYKLELEKVGFLFGQIPVEEFDEARAKLTPPDPEDFRTFREDYEFYGAETGEVIADYLGLCSTCGLGTSFTKTCRFWSPEDEAT